MSAHDVLWIALPIVVVTALVLDLFVFHKANEPIPTRDAFIWTGIWASLGLLFGVAIWIMLGPTVGTEFFTGYLIEYSLSVDNVAVFAILFAALAVPPELRYRALFWGVIIAIGLRGILIAIGGALLNQFWWMTFVFGVFLIVTGIRMARHTDTTEHPEDSRILTTLRRVFPVTDGYHGQTMTIVQDGTRYVTPLFIALLALAFFDLMFAVDSVPAIYAVTKDPFIVLAANAFALLGLRTLYFAIATSLERFVYLQPTLAIVLGWVGFKMIISHWFHMPAPISLAVVLLILASGIIASVRKNRQADAPAGH